jgi:hypothetical protein
MCYWVIPLIAFGLSAVYLGVRMLLSNEFTRCMCQAKGSWNFKSRLVVKLLGLERAVVVARWSSPIIILVDVG